ncbi:MAG: SIR2 family protein, partial [Chloroflexi bacterium]|nr:SIR2 family protein [Chloroflexota bacterium]
LLAEDIKSGEVSLENELRRYSKHQSDVLREAFKYIPPYLRDLIYRCTARYASLPSNYIRLILSLVEEHGHEVLFIVMNYDELLEKAISHIYPEIIFRSLAPYINNGKNLMVLKLHGSTNWFISMEDGGDWNNALENFDITTRPTEGHPIIFEDAEQASSAHSNKQSCYPLLTAPLAGKMPSDIVAPDEHVAAAKDFLSDCQKFLIIGCSGLDDDLLSLLNEKVTGSPAVHLVTGSGQAKEVANRFVAGVPSFRQALYHQSNPRTKFDEGFHFYLATESFEDFLRY